LRGPDAAVEQGIASESAKVRRRVDAGRQGVKGRAMEQGIYERSVRACDVTKLNDQVVGDLISTPNVLPLVQQQEPVARSR
jgi:hypothetical protein